VTDNHFLPPLVNASCPESETLEEYGRLQQHTVLLEDEWRVGQFLRAIASKKRTGVVVDVGAGTGILGLLALRYGCDQAFLIEPSRKMAIYAQHVAELNGLSERITILNTTLESCDFRKLPASVDLVVTETLSSLIFGFGCWDRLPELASRLTTRDDIVPRRGTLYGCLCREELATRGSQGSGFRLLKRAGVIVDLFEHTFRSGGNVYDKSVVNDAISSGALSPCAIAHFDFRDFSCPIKLEEHDVLVPEEGVFTGIVLFWEVVLSDGANGPVVLRSTDNRLTSWYPCYVPFVAPLQLGTGDILPVQLVLHPIDTPYKYALQLVTRGRALSRAMYW
jgi:hypothetical protein